MVDLEEREMGQIVIDDIDATLIERLAEQAAARQTSVATVAREILLAALDPKRVKLLERMDAIRAMSPSSDIDSTSLIRADRDDR
jgi:plasmid stability protein